jgi:hypothetical protein
VVFYQRDNELILLIEPRQLVPSITFGGAFMYREGFLTVAALFALRFSQGVFYDS